MYFHIEVGHHVDGHIVPSIHQFLAHSLVEENLQTFSKVNADLWAYLRIQELIDYIWTWTLFTTVPDCSPCTGQRWRFCIASCPFLPVQIQFWRHLQGKRQPLRRTCEIISVLFIQFTQEIKIGKSYYVKIMTHLAPVDAVFPPAATPTRNSKINKVRI